MHKVTDGDTYWVHLDLGFRCLPLLVNIRLYGYDCPELTKGSAHERAQGQVARSYAAAWLRPGVWVETLPDPDNFGRWLGALWTEDTKGTRSYLGAELVARDLATVWPQRWRTLYDTDEGWT